jgi:hypothetical protein
MIQVSRYIQHDARLGTYTLEVTADGENETLSFAAPELATQEQAALLSGGAEYLPAALDGPA